MKNQGKTIIAGLMVMAIMLSLSLTYSRAFAQESDIERQAVDKLTRPHTILAGTGAAVGEDNHGWRSHFRLGIVSENQDTSVTPEYQVKQGMFVVGKQDNRHVFSVITDTWTMSVRSDKTSFDASGTVENRDGKTLDVKITGEKIAELQQGNLYNVKGTASDVDGKVYDLFYFSTMYDRNPSIRQIPVESELS